METDALIRNARYNNGKNVTSTYHATLNTEAQKFHHLHAGILYEYNPSSLYSGFNVYKLPQVKEGMFIGNISKRELIMVLETSNRWLRITSTTKEGWVAIPRQFQENSSLFKEVKQYPAYLDVPSRHMFFFDGRQMTGPDVWYFYFTIVSILLSGIFFVVFVASQFLFYHAIILSVSSFDVSPH